MTVLLAVPYDKGTGICVMKRESYDQKMCDILNTSVQEIYIRQEKCHASSTERRTENNQHSEGFT